MKRRFKTSGQAAKNKFGHAIVFGGKTVYDEEEGDWHYKEWSDNSGDDLDAFFSELAPGEGPVDIEIIIRKK